MMQDSEAAGDSLGNVRRHREAAMEPDAKIANRRCRLNGIITTEPPL